MDTGISTGEISIGPTDMGPQNVSLSDQLPPNVTLIPSGEVNPAAAVQGMADTDEAISEFVAAIESEITAGMDQLAALIGPSIAQLQSRVQKQINTLNTLLGNVYAALQTILNSEQFLLNTNLSTTLANIGQLLGQSNADIVGGTPSLPQGGTSYGTPVAGGVPPFPTPGGPSYPPYPGPGYPPYPPYPGTGGLPYPTPSMQPYPGVTFYCPPYPGQPSFGGGAAPPYPTGPGGPPSPSGEQGGTLIVSGVSGESTPPPSSITNLIINNVTNTVSQISNTVVSTSTVTYNNYQYTPTFNVYNNGGGITLNNDGTPAISVSYDVQPDNSVVVNVGPISVHVSVPPNSANPNAPVCPLVPVGQDGVPIRA